MGVLLSVKDSDNLLKRVTIHLDPIVRNLALEKDIEQSFVCVNLPANRLKAVIKTQ